MMRLTVCGEHPASCAAALNVPARSYAAVIFTVSPADFMCRPLLWWLVVWLALDIQTHREGVYLHYTPPFGPIARLMEGCLHS